VDVAIPVTSDLVAGAPHDCADCIEASIQWTPVPITRSEAMTTQAGLWIDHRRAVIVTVSGEGVSEKVVDSNVEKRVRYSGGTGSGERGSRGGEGEDKRERYLEGQLDRYYDEVVADLRGAESILIFGPGEAKAELKTRLEHHGLGDRITGIETADKMTHRQISAKVRQRFAPVASLRVKPGR
jgi:hypothetical protein